MRAESGTGCRRGAGALLRRAGGGGGAALGGGANTVGRVTFRCKRARRADGAGHRTAHRCAARLADRPPAPVRIAATGPTPEDVLELRHQVELHNLTGRIVECPLDEINRPRASAPAKGTLSRPRLWGDLESVWATKTMGRVAG